MAELHDDFEQRYGLVRIGGDLAPTTLVQAYCTGVFPWFDEDWPICWWSPDPRAIFELHDFHVPRRLARTLRSGKFTVTVDRAFGDVIRGCADRAEGSWVTPSMIDAYERLHRLGIAHSVEAWRGGALAGGLYGVALGGFFAGESMFTRITDGSKIALAFTVEHLKARRFELFDTQFLTEHTARLGAIEIPRRQYLQRLQSALLVNTSFVEK
ncbi:MAG: leucyl/phenylalanyl-tRNA--protein transferase [Gemmataceae bacterium]|nr:leucyl/phenylalanyl-tRNA--protein transferase [Gemmataceae bacterium]